MISVAPQLWGYRVLTPMEWRQGYLWAWTHFRLSSQYWSCCLNAGRCGAYLWMLSVLLATWSLQSLYHFLFIILSTPFPHHLFWGWGRLCPITYLLNLFVLPLWGTIASAHPYLVLLSFLDTCPRWWNFPALLAVRWGQVICSNQ